MSHAEQSESVRLREVALAQAAHDLKGSGKPEDAVTRAKVYLGFLAGSQPAPAGLTDAQIKHMAGRFLGWKLPADFSPDGGVTFAKPTGVNAGAHWPTGTNLFYYEQAVQMIRYLAADLSEV